MADDNEIVAPTQAPLTHLQGQKKNALPFDRRILFIAAAVVLVIALAFTWRPTIDISRNLPTGNGSAAVQAVNDETPPPFEATQRAIARERAQQSLAAFVEKQIQLENDMQVQAWGGDLLEQALARAKQGDEDFVLEKYESSLAAYEQAVALIDDVVEAGDRLFEESISETRDAISALDHPRAEQALNQALIIKPQSVDALALKLRVEKIPEIQILLRDAKNHELSDRYDEALEVYERVKALDPQTDQLTELIAAARVGRTGRDLQSLISRGFADLAASRFDAARGAFDAALKIDPDNEMAIGGLQQVAEQNDLAVIRRHRSQGEKALQEEDWQVAQKHFGDILKLDSNIQFAKDGMAQAREHQRITTILQKITTEPQRLSSQALFLEAQEILADAENLAYRGDTLESLMEEGRRLLALYRNPVDVVFISDNATDIIVSNIGRIGRFDRKVLNLRPGAYTIRGSQSGCKDIYLSIEVIPGVGPVDLSCTERLGNP